jgi:hypothetical protein
MSNFLAQSDLTDAFAGPVQVFSGDTPQVATKGETLTSGQNLTAGAVVARTTATGKLVQFNPAGSAGTQIAVGVLVHDCNATSADTACEIYTAGCFNAAYLQWNGATAIQQAAALDGTKMMQKALYWSAGIAG